MITMVPSDADPLYIRDQKCDQTLMHTYWLSETPHPRYKKAQVSSPGNSEEIKSNVHLSFVILFDLVIVLSVGFSNLTNCDGLRTTSLAEHVLHRLIDLPSYYNYIINNITFDDAWCSPTSYLLL